MGFHLKDGSAKVYTEFFQLLERPFDLNPSPRFLYLGENHGMALAFLTYNLRERRGIALLTGEPGTGKTTMVHALLAKLDRDRLQAVYLSNPLLSSNEFVDYLAYSFFKKKVHFKSRAAFLSELETFLRQFLHHRHFILIIDEAQALSFELLEEVRLISHMEYGGEKLLNLFLVGQPEIVAKIEDPQFKDLLDQIVSRYQIAPLDLKGTEEYVNSRLRTAGASGEEDIFTEKAIQALYAYSQGYPRVINVLADNCLILGYSKGQRRITASMVAQCHGDTTLGEPVPQEPTEAPHLRISESRFGPRRLARMAVFLSVFLVSFVATFGFDLPDLKGRRILSFLSKPFSMKQEVLEFLQRQRKGLPHHVGRKTSPDGINSVGGDKKADLSKIKDEKRSRIITVKDGGICRDLDDRKPVGLGNTFPAGVGRLYCLTEILLLRPDTDATHIIHVWYFGRSEMARVTLPVRASNWRTYSSKTIQPRQVGDWHVDILDSRGELMKTFSFRVLP
jgi:general secretion pathway protein A